MPAAQEEFNSIMALGQQVQDLGKGIENPYTIITLEVCKSINSITSSSVGILIGLVFF